MNQFKPFIIFLFLGLFLFSTPLQGVPEGGYACDFSMINLGGGNCSSEHYTVQVSISQDVSHSVQKSDHYDIEDVYRIYASLWMIH